MTARKLSKELTNIQIKWIDKDEFSKFRLPTKRYKNSKLEHNEADHQVFSRFMKIILELSEAQKIEKYADRLQKYDQVIGNLNKPSEMPLAAIPIIQKS